LTGDPPPAPYVEDDRAATLGDIRTLRRWLLVTAVWAVAATALGVIALIQANKDDTSGRTQSAADLARVQRDLAGRIDDLKSQVDDLPTSDDLSKLDGRIKDVEKKADSTGSDLDKLNGRVDDLEKRVDDLESSSQTQTNTTTSP
jgi:polyhydroxyalkanoate synthesis regulator phasin